MCLGMPLSELRCVISSSLNIICEADAVILSEMMGHNVHLKHIKEASSYICMSDNTIWYSKVLLRHERANSCNCTIFLKSISITNDVWFMYRWVKCDDLDTTLLQIANGNMWRLWMWCNKLVYTWKIEVSAFIGYFTRYKCRTPKDYTHRCALLFLVNGRFTSICQVFFISTLEVVKLPLFQWNNSKIKAN